jgi:hypothetical protein
MVWPIPIEPSKIDPKYPGFLHAIYGLILCAPLYLREFLPFKSRSPYYYVTLGLNICLFAVIAQLILGPKYTFTYNLANTMVISALVLTWLGMRSVAGFAWIVVSAVSAYALLKTDADLKNFGLLFVICAFFSLIFQSDLTPKEMFSTFKEEFKGVSQSQRLESVKESMKDAVETGGRIITTTTGIVK